VFLGAVQLPADGQPILLSVDHQTTGGYPIIAGVIAADLGRLGQLRPADRVRFAAVSLEEADALHFAQEQLMASPGRVC
jgi:allophanate hydrolase subunit 2